jgi:hypothetical protein
MGPHLLHRRGPIKLTPKDNAMKKKGRKTKYIVLAITIFSFLCVFLFAFLVFPGPMQTMFEPRAPQRNFTVRDLLIDGKIVSTEWQSFPPGFPYGDDLVTDESSLEQFGIVQDNTNLYLASQSVYRYPTIGMARRIFKGPYAAGNIALKPAKEWTYQSPIAYQTSFGCIEYTDARYCDWIGNYDEYIVVFITKIIPSQMTFHDIERIVQAIDQKMAFYLKIPFPTLPNR